MRFTESTVEDAALVRLERACWQVAHVPEVASDMPVAQQTDCGEILQERWLLVR